MLNALQHNPLYLGGVGHVPLGMLYSQLGEWPGDESMVAYRSERRVMLLRVKPRVVPAEADKPTSLEEVIQILEAERAAGRARCDIFEEQLIDDDDLETLRDETNQIYIAQIKRDPTNSTITLLINRGNPNAVSPALIKPASNDVSYIQPGAKQSPGSSAHFVISTKWEDGHHRAGYEKMPHVSGSLASAAIDRIVSRAVKGNSKYLYDAKKSVGIGKNKKIEIVKTPYRPVLFLERIPSENLKHDLSQGELSGVTLTKKVTTYTGVGADQRIKYQEQKIIFHARDNDKSAAQALVADLAAWGKEQSYETVTLHIGKLPNKQTSNPTLSLTEDALESLYVRAQVINGFSVLLEGCYSDICAEIESKIIALVNGS